MSADPRDWADRPYVRVYQSVRDEEFAMVYDDDRALAAWLRLLLEADHVFPARPSLPAGLSRHARDLLVKADVLRVTGRTYTISGLSKERAARAMTGAERQALWRARHRNASVTERNVSDVTSDVTPRGRAGASDSYSYSYSLHSSESDVARAHEETPSDVLDGPLAYYELTGKYPPHGSTLHDWVTRLAEEHGPDEFQRALASEYTVSRNLKDLLSRTESRLARLQDETRSSAERERSRREAAAAYRALQEEAARRERLAAEPVRPLAEIDPELAKFGRRSA